MASQGAVRDEDIGPCLHTIFRESAAKYADRVAVQSAKKQITYKELDEATDRLASMLVQAGVKKDSCVGILMERCNEYALAYIAILKAGGAYMPIDPGYPQGMLEDVLTDATPTVVLCKRNFVARMPESQTVILLEPEWEQCLDDLTPEGQAALDNVDKTDLDALAYVVYSSGTTGKPKGIACPHRGAVFSYKWRFENVPYNESKGPEVEACNVFFVWEMMRPLLRGQTLLVIPDDVIYDPPALTAFLQTNGVTRMLFTPSLLEAVLDCKSIEPKELFGRMRSMTTIILCGEVVTVALQERVKANMPWAALWNLYSVSECHDVAALDLAGGEYGSRKYCPVGKLFDGVEAHVMDDSLAPCPLGEVGELYVAGPTLARGYLNRDELNRQRFPVVDGKRLYKTGDRARVLPNRELEILGRCDSMVKVRGYSVELRAIEAAIMTLDTLVSSCVVVVQGEEGEDKFVIAYVVLRTTAEATCRNVRLALKAKLPHYMVPAFVIDLEELPTHEVSGKLDKKSLPPVDLATGQLAGRNRSMSTENDVTLPRSTLEFELHKIWCNVMNMRQIDVVFDSFFDIGGHSLLAARLVQQIKSDLGHDVGVVELFANSTIEALAEFIERKPSLERAGSSGSVVSAVTPKHKKLDLDAEVDVFDASKAINDIAMRAFWRSTHFAQVRARAVLVTGVTGFLGSFILAELLRNDDIDVVYCVVRAATPKEGADRVIKTLKDRDMWNPEDRDRIQVFAGDASLHHMGLDDDDYAVLSTGVDVVVHCAAIVNLVYPYEGLRAANVIGTRNVIEFALHGKVKKLAYISTDGVFPDGMKDCKEDADLDSFTEKLGNGYAQSKWVAEKLVRRAMDRGLPAIVFRPGNLGGVGSVWNPSDLNFLVLTGCIEVGATPNVPGWCMEMTPVDFASQAIVKIIQDKESLGETFHVTNFGNCLEANAYFDALRNVGYGLESCSLESWRAKVLRSSSPNTEKLRNALLGGAADTEASLADLATFDNSNFAKYCKQYGMVIPKITTTLMHEYVEAWQKAGLVSEPETFYGRPLTGKVAVVTGASSGIGAAIARALSKAGAKVGIGGRRLERLQALADEMKSSSGGQVFPFQVDVTNREQVGSFFKACEAELGPADIFVNNAGVMHYTRIEHLKEDQWHKEVDVNCKGLLNCTAAALPSMLARGKGHIVATSSDAGRKVFPGLGVYSASKMFVEGFCQALRLENCDKGIKVTTIQPGDCRTELPALTTDETARSEFAQSSQDRDVWLDPEDVARAVVFAVSSPAHVGINEVLIEPRGAPA
ncbi:L-2-aminoadipate reductase [Hondaea fermentalgiana]|uniref:L-2-aminoadipate reductase n=1 Tax=Hondaea fermentalgiana TaxID=2315210 RepID=A0A2R5GJB1_9STRA|nr:L-2-aminoadipate reductase [Hondaea fermentalgiana]|eukprot:GBG30972.1 L-2-aminoadipate reductase [Hondaea fermentalgiana]